MEDQIINREALGKFARRLRERERSSGTIEKYLRDVRAFSAWLGNGHTDLDNPNTILLRIRLTQGVLMSHGTRYDLDFTQKENSE